jgi:hypothetical protein
MTTTTPNLIVTSFVTLSRKYNMNQILYFRDPVGFLANKKSDCLRNQPLLRYTPLGAYATKFHSLSTVAGF